MINPLTKSFRLKLISSYLLILAVTFSLLGFFIDRHLERNSLHEIETSLIYQADIIRTQLSSEKIIQKDIVFLEDLVNRINARVHCRITLVSASGTVLADSGKAPQELAGLENHSNRPEMRMALRGLTGIDTRYSGTLKMEMLYVALPIERPEGICGAIRLALPLASVQRTLGITRGILTAGFCFALLFAILLGSLIARQTTQPIRKMIQVSQKFSEGVFNRRVLLPDKDELGVLAATLNTMADQIEEKVRQVQAEHQKLTAIFESMIESVIVVDKNGYVVSLNPAAEKTLGFSERGSKGRNFLEVSRNQALAGIIDDVLKQGASVSREAVLVRPEHKIFQVNAVPIFDKKVIGGCLVVIHDITEMRKLERMRSDFVSNVSHELKTPLTSIIGFTEALLDGAIHDQENGPVFLGIIRDHAARLNAMVGDLLALSYLESKEVEVVRKTFSARSEFARALTGSGALIKKKGITVTNELSDNLLITADPVLFDHVVTNLIDNSIKFNKERGSIRIYGEDLAGQVKISVEDTGIGIPSRDLSRIFERFYRVDKARSRELGGTGLGLAIVKHVIELHGGTLGVRSVEGSGSTFWFTLPR